jgi:hypothetical protein
MMGHVRMTVAGRRRQPAKGLPKVVRHGQLVAVDGGFLASGVNQ